MDHPTGEAQALQLLLEVRELPEIRFLLIMRDQVSSPHLCNPVLFNF